jgi:uncharacterized membrane protein YfcA
MTQKQMNLGVIVIGLLAGGFGVYRLFYAKPVILLGCLAIVPAAVLYSYWNKEAPFRDEDSIDDIINYVGRFLLVAGVIAGFLGLGVGGGECNSRFC